MMPEEMNQETLQPFLEMLEMYLLGDPSVLPADDPMHWKIGFVRDDLEGRTLSCSLPFQFVRDHYPKQFAKWVDRRKNE